MSFSKMAPEAIFFESPLSLSVEADEDADDLVRVVERRAVLAALDALRVVVAHAHAVPRGHHEFPAASSLVCQQFWNLDNGKDSQVVSC